MNKNTKRLAVLKAQAVRKKQTQFTVNVPAGDYHNHEKGSFTTKTVHVSCSGGVVSQNRRRNTQMKCLINTGEDGKKQSVTVHEPINKDDFMTFKNHTYLKKEEAYKQVRT